MAFTGKDPKDTYLAVLNLGDAQETLPATTPTETVLDAAGNASILGLSQTTIEFIGVLLADVASGVVMETGIDFEADAVTTSSVLYQSDTAVGVFWTTGDPEGSLTAGIGSLALRDDGVAGGTLYIKETGVGNTGWVPYDFVTDFLDLGDTPGTFTADKWMKVNSGGTAIEWADAPLGEFTGLSDTPANYTGSGGKTLRVNAAPDGVEFVDSDFLSLTDTPGAYTGDGLLQVNTGGTAIAEILSSAAHGEVIYRGASSWIMLGVGSDGDVLTTHSTGADPTWETLSGSGLPAANHGDLIYYNGSNWVARTYDTAGKMLTTNGIGSAPTWEAGLPTSGAAQGEVIYWSGTAWVALGVGTDGDMLTTHSTAANPTWETPSTVTDFISLTDVDEADYTGHGGHLVRVNSTPDGLEFVANTVVNAAFSDMPTDYSSDGDIVYTNGSDAWQYQGISFFMNEHVQYGAFPDDGEMMRKESTGMGWYTFEFPAMSDTPSSYSGEGLAFLSVNTGESSLEFCCAGPDDHDIIRYDSGSGNWEKDTLPKFHSGTGSPEGTLSADVGAQYHRTDGSTTDILYVKATGTGNTGWALVTTTTAT